MLGRRHWRGFFLSLDVTVTVVRRPVVLSVVCLVIVHLSEVCKIAVPLPTEPKLKIPVLRPNLCVMFCAA